MGNTLNIGLGLKSGGSSGSSGGGNGAFQWLSGSEGTFTAGNYLHPRKGGGAMEEEASLTTTFEDSVNFETNIADGIRTLSAYRISFAMVETSLAVGLQFGLFKVSPSDGDTDFTYTFTDLTGAMQPDSTTNGIKEFSGSISETLTAGTLYSFGFHNPSGGTEITDLYFWGTIYY